MELEEMKRFARERVDALFNRGELERVEEFVTEDFVNHEAWPGEDPGYEGFRLRLRRLREAIPDLHMEVHEVIAEGDMVAYRATLTGTQRGPLLGIPPTDRSFSAQQMHFLRLAGGRAAEHWACRDDLGMLMQLGIIPPMGPRG